MKFKFLKKIKKWLFIKKKDVNSENTLYLYHSKKIVVLLFVFLFLSFAIAMTFISLWKTGAIMVSVPDVTNKPLIEALIKIQNQSLKARIKTVLFPNKPAGIVVTQDPKGGFMTREKRSVMLFVNQPVKEGETPNLIGKTVVSATKALTTANNKKLFARIIRNAYAYSDTVPAGHVISQTPNPGTPARIPLQISLLISKGKLGSVITLPDFSGRSALAAAKWLSANGVSVKQIATGSGADGVIQSQSPSAGSSIKRGSLVLLRTGGSQKIGVFDFIFPTELKLAQQNIRPVETKTDDDKLTQAQQAAKKKNAEEKRQTSLIIKGTQAYNVAVILTVNGETKTIFNEKRKPDQKLHLTFPYSSSATLEMRINGKKFIERKYN